MVSQGRIDNPEKSRAKLPAVLSFPSKKAGQQHAGAAVNTRLLLAASCYDLKIATLS